MPSRISKVFSKNSRGAKFGNVKTRSADGQQVFDSAWEAACYEKFCLLQMAGKVKSIRCQVRYNLNVNGMMVAYYLADFVVEWTNGKELVYDAKGVETDVFRLKSKLMMAVHNIPVLLIKKKDKSSYPWLSC